MIPHSCLGFSLCLCNSLPPKEVYKPFVCLLAVWQSYCANMMGLKVFLEEKSELIEIITIRCWDKISGRDHHLVVIRRIWAFSSCSICLSIWVMSLSKNCILIYNNHGFKFLRIICHTMLAFLHENCCQTCRPTISLPVPRITEVLCP